MYQCRLLALTLPTTTLLRSTMCGRDVGHRRAASCAPPVPTPVRHTTPPARRPLDRIGDDLPDAGTLDDDVRLEADIRDVPGVVRRAEGPHEFRLRPRFDPVQDVNVQPALLADEGGKKTDRPRTGDEHGPRLPEGTLADRDDLLPRFRDHRRGFEQYAEEPEGGSTFIAYSGSMRQRSDMKPSICLMPRSVYWPLRHMSHSPTAQLGHGMGSGRRTMPTTRSPSLQPAARARIQHTAEGFVAQYEARLAGRRPAVLPLHDLDVGPADADGDGFDKYRALACVGLGDILQPCGPRLLRLYGNRLHVVTCNCCKGATAESDS